MRDGPCLLAAVGVPRRGRRPPAPWAAADPNTIAVAGTATVKGPPTTVVILAPTSGEAELAADAAVKFGDLKKKATNRPGRHGQPRPVGRAPGVRAVDQAIDPAQQQRIMQGNGRRADAAKQKVQITEQVKLVLHHVDGQPTRPSG